MWDLIEAASEQVGPAATIEDLFAIRTEIEDYSAARRSRDLRHAVTMTDVPSGANCQSAIASVRRWRMQPWLSGVPSCASVCTARRP